MTTAVTRIAFDANIFFYAIDERDPAKHHRCRDLLQNAIAAEIGVAPLQALGEFAYAAVRKDLLDRSEAALMARDWAIVFEVIAASPDAFELALTWWRDEQLSYWDALLVATVAKAGVTALLSVDNAGQDKTLKRRFRQRFSGAHSRRQECQGATVH